MKSNYTHTDQEIAFTSESIIQARRTSTGLSEFPGVLPETLESAYRIQDLSMSKWKDTLVGWKVGGIQPHFQDKYCDERLSGPIYSSNMKYSQAASVAIMPVFEHGYAAIEAEYIMQLGNVEELASEGLTEKQVIDAVDKVYIGVEIASSPIQNINDLGPVGPISDFGNNAGMLIGPEVKNWKKLDFPSVEITVDIDGVIHGPTNTQSGLKGPLGAVKFLIEQLKRRGHDLLPGTFVCTGAITGVHDSNVGAESIVRFGDLGEMKLSLVSNLD